MVCSRRGRQTSSSLKQAQAKCWKGVTGGNFTFYRTGNVERDQEWRQVGRELKQMRSQNEDLKIVFVAKLKYLRARYEDDDIIGKVLDGYQGDLKNQVGVILNEVDKNRFSDLQEDMGDIPCSFESLCETRHWHAVRKVDERFDRREEIVKAEKRLVDFVDGIGQAQEEQGAVEAEGCTTNVPGLPAETCLNFSAKDDSGKPLTLEGKLKDAVLKSVTSKQISAATGRLRPGFGVVGMAGVGKTVALKGLALDTQIRDRYVDGVLYMSLGHDADAEKVIKQLADVVRVAGASDAVEKVKNSETLTEAVNFSVDCFWEKTCLILVDDIWPTEECEFGFLLELRQLLRRSPKSRMALTTRSMEVAMEAGPVVKFEARDQYGPVSKKIFLSRATRIVEDQTTSDCELRASVQKILRTCAGLPLALAIAGFGVALLTEEFPDFYWAADNYAKGLEKGTVDVGETRSPEGAILSECTHRSLKIVEAAFSKLKEKYCGFSNHTVADLYSSFCVMKHQAWVPVSVFGRMWNMEEDEAMEFVRLLSRLSLCTLSHQRRTDGSSTWTEGGVTLHDLQLEFCQKQTGRLKGSEFWHSQLLDGYWKQEHGTFTQNGEVESTDLSLERPLSNAFLRFLSRLCLCTRSHQTSMDGSSTRTKVEGNGSRPWWDAPNDGYIHENVSRHLCSANLVSELAALVLDARWTHNRMMTGGLLALERDFDRVRNRPEIKERFDVLWSAIRVSWGHGLLGKRAFLFQMCGRLMKPRAGNEIVDSYVKSLEEYTPKPFLLPVNSFLPSFQRSQIMEIPVGSRCEAVACSPCGRFIAAGGGYDVVLLESETGGILKRLEGHSGTVCCLSFDAESKKIFSGSDDGAVGVWDLEATGSSPQFLKGHSGYVASIGGSHDGRKLFSCSVDKSLRVWDIDSGGGLKMFHQEDNIWSVAVSTDDETVAIGLQDGTLKVLNSDTGEAIFEDAKAHRIVLCAISFSANGHRLATGSWDETIRVWDTTRWSVVGDPFKGHTDYVNSVAFSPDGRQVVSASNDETVRVWDVDSGATVWTSSRVGSSMWIAAFTPNGKRIISGSVDGYARIWDPQVPSDEVEREIGHSSLILGVAISDDGKKVASASDDWTVRLWDVLTGHQICVCEGHETEVYCVSFSGDGRQLVSGDRSGTVRLWDTMTFRPIWEWKWHTNSVWSVFFSFDGRRVVSGSFDRIVYVFDVQSGERIGDKLEEGGCVIYCVAETRDGKFVVAQDENYEVFIWNSDSQGLIWKSASDVRSGDSISLKNAITDENAERIIRSCGQQTPHLWPKSFPPYSTRVAVDWKSVYANTPRERTLLATLPSDVSYWKCDVESKLFVAGFMSGAVAICKLTSE